MKRSLALIQTTLRTLCEAGLAHLRQRWRISLRLRLRPKGLPFSRHLVWALFLTLVVPSPAWSHDDDRPPALRGVALDQKLGEQLPLGLALQDETGRTVHLGDYFGKRPVILTFAYYQCQDLCPLLLDGLVRSLRPLSFSAGNEFDILTVSFDPHDTPSLAMAKKSDFIKRYSRPGADAGWHFLMGDEATVQRLTESVGFRYNYDTENARYAHATGIMILTPEGKIARYFYGIEFSPRDLRLGLIEASADRIGSPIDQLLLFCYHYDPATGKYGLLINSVIRLAGIATALALGSYVFVMLRGESKQKRKSPKPA
jgi:protein SCO1/2